MGAPKQQTNLHYPHKTGPVYSQEHYYNPIKLAPGSYIGPLTAKDAPRSSTIAKATEDTSHVTQQQPLVFKPFSVKDLTLANRFVVAPMCMYSSEDGFMSSYHLAHLGSFAIHGAGLIIAEASAVEPRGRISPQDAGIWSDDHIHGIKQVADFIHAQGSKMGIQLAHAGRKADFWNDDVVAPTGGLAWSNEYPTPRELSVDEIHETVKAFGAAAVRAAKAGLDIVEIHAAHGYLIHSFLSPVTNHRTDRYGGSLENRARFLLEIIHTVREHFPAHKPIGLRVSATDWLEHLDTPSWEIEQTVQIARWAHEAGVDVFHVSSGGNDARQKITLQPGYQVPFAERVKKAVPGLAVIAVGAITSGKQAEAILQEGKADLIAGARIFLHEPNFVLRAAVELGAKVQFSPQYERGRR
ncbi:hypothetical protein BGZ94_009871 [Podila epigama]|nr:hypothetical protein BGZ94_009871 [Podila epigama]